MVATKLHRGVHKDTLHQPQNTNYLRDTIDNTPHMIFEGEPAVILHAKNIEVGTSVNGNRRQDQVTTGRVNNNGSTNHESFSFLRIQYHAVTAPFLNPGQFPVNGSNTSRSVCRLANNCRQCGVISLGI